jgi:NAD+ kinase
MKRIGLISNNRNKKAINISREIYDYLIKKKIEVNLLLDDAMPVKYDLCTVSEKDFCEKTDLIISVGGDGTFLRAARYSFYNSIPVMGINVGNLGFLAEVDLKDRFKSIDDVLENSYKIEKRMLLELEIYRGGKLLKINEPQNQFIALNEFTITRALMEKIIEIGIIINDDEIISYRADGIIIATPTGSTAYSLSAGGPVVEPKNEVVLVTPLCAHNLFSRSMILDTYSKIEIKISTKNINDNLSVDGVRQQVTLKSGDIFRIKKSPLKLNLVTFNNNAFFKVFKEKLLRC